MINLPVRPNVGFAVQTPTIEGVRCDVESFEVDVADALSRRYRWFLDARVCVGEWMGIFEQDLEDLQAEQLIPRR